MSIPDQTVLTRRMLGFAAQCISEARDALKLPAAARASAAERFDARLAEINFFLGDPDQAEAALEGYSRQQGFVCDAAEDFVANGCASSAGIEQEVRKLQRLRGQNTKPMVHRRKTRT
ncbi:MAG: hypothetical protein KGL39_44775 [Patescibacteria group bacterium]|nr:hypothetical protein [Patescibacteria group bacterium]